MTRSKFIEFVKAECKKNGIKCILSKSKTVKLGKDSYCAGYFDHYNKELRVAMGHKISYSILVHEYCHLTQWIDQCKTWIRCEELNTHRIDEWLDGKAIHNIDAIIDAVRDLELDNEKRSVKLIKKLGLAINTEQYIRKANSYIFFYTWMKKGRMWPPKTKSPYMCKKILSQCPSKFLKEYSILPPLMESAMDEHYLPTHIRKPKT